MRFRKSSEEEPRLGITPLIDIVFLLLIFFMLTSHFHVASGIPIRLPEVDRKTRDDAREKVALVIDRRQRLYFKGKEVELADLKPLLAERMQREGSYHLILEADREVRHGLVVRVMDIAKSAGVASIIIAARWEPEKVM